MNLPRPFVCLARRSFTLAAGLALIACQNAPAELTPEVEVGVFYGGQIQRLTSIEVSPVTPPRFGFRVIFPPAGDETQALVRKVSYEIVKPGPAGRRVTEEGNLEIPRGQTQLDHVVEFPEDAKLGVWNVRVVWSDRILADRALYLVRRN